jgi:solute carrier family 9B (sodium/hydrogen exchanger), member 1/2
LAISIAFIIVLGLLGDYLFRKMKLPGLLGMLIVGILIGPYVLNILRPEIMNVSGDFRKIALIVILLRAGFELRRDTLNRVGRAALLMSAVPAIFEIAGVTLIAPHFLDISYLEAAILGSILGAVSPAVVVPIMIDFMDRGRGQKKGIPTLILGASSIDDVFVIVIFTSLLSMYGGGEVNLWAKAAEIPVSIILGILIGLIAGYFLYHLFLRYNWRPPKRTLVVLGMGIFLTWLEQISEGFIPIAGLLGVMAIGFIILEKSEAIVHIISQKLKKLWVFAELLLFVLIGAQVNIHVAWKAGLAGTVIIIGGLIFRSVGTYLSLMGTDLTQKERLFSVVAYIPKATVQAAIGAIPLAAGVASGEVILAISVLSIIITAPIGAIGIMILGEKILDYGENSSYAFKDLREKLGLPSVGNRLRNKKDDSIWKVIEKKEVWIKETESVMNKESSSAVPAILLRLWHEESSESPGTGKTESHRFSAVEPGFDETWEILYDW